MPIDAIYLNLGVEILTNSYSRLDVRSDPPPVLTTRLQSLFLQMPVQDSRLEPVYVPESVYLALATVARGSSRLGSQRLLDHEPTR